MYYAAISLYPNPAPGNPVGRIVSLHTSKDKAYSAAVNRLKAYDVVPVESPEIMLIANVTQRFVAQTQVYRHDLENGDVIKLNAISWVSVKSI